MSTINWIVTSKTGRPDIDGVVQKIEYVGRRGRTVYARPRSPSAKDIRCGVDFGEDERLVVLDGTT